MKDTLEMMKNIVKGQPKKSIDELITEYQNNNNGNILAYMYISNYGLICRVAEKWTKLDDTDKASFCLQELDKALRNFDKSNNVKFATYFYTCFNNRLRTETESVMTHKRKSNLYLEINEYKDDILSDYYVEDNYFENDNSFLDNYKLTKNEKSYCKLVINGYSKREISGIINTTIQGIYYINNNVRKKLLNLL